MSFCIILFPNLQEGIQYWFSPYFCVAYETPASIIQQMHKYSCKTGLPVKDAVDLQTNDK